jgi:hypothetical protein
LKALFFDVDVERFILCMKRSLKYSSVHQSRHVGCSILKWELNFQRNGRFAMEVLDTAPILARWLQYFDVGTKFSRQRSVCHGSLGYRTNFGSLGAVF